MSVTWTCDRCKRFFSDNGVRVSKLPVDWIGYYLAKVADETTGKGEIKETIHLCFHCSSQPMPIEIAISK